MNLLIFDIDGTILDSVKTDDRCFVQTFNDLHQIDLRNIDWNGFKNVTDSGLTHDIFKKWMNRIPNEDEVKAIKLYYKDLLGKGSTEISEIDYAMTFLNKIKRDSEFEIGFATGGWKETAMLKCNSVGFSVEDHLFRSSSDHYNRARIVELVIEDAKRKRKLESFDSIVYFGDGLWDFKTTLKLGIDFIGVDYHNNGKLKHAGAPNVIQDYRDTTKILKWINGK